MPGLSASTDDKAASVGDLFCFRQDRGTEALRPPVRSPFQFLTKPLCRLDETALQQRPAIGT
jgi:hypothetical protein